MKFYQYVVATTALALLSGCGDTTTEDTQDTQLTQETITTAVTSTTAFAPDAGRLLASQCFGCHGTNGYSTNKWDSIAGEDNLHGEMFEDDEEIMYLQAKGYTSDEITYMENWFSSQSSSSVNESEEEDDDEDEEDDD